MCFVLTEEPEEAIGVRRMKRNLAITKTAERRHLLTDFSNFHHFYYGIQ